MASTSGEETTTQTKITGFVKKQDAEERRGAKRSRDSHDTVDVDVEQKKADDEDSQLNFSHARKIRRCRPESTKEEHLPSTSKTTSDKVQEKTPDIKRSRSPDDIPDTEPGAVETGSEEPENRVKCGKKRQRSCDEGDSEVPAPKKLKRLSLFFNKLGKEMNTAMKEICSSTKDAVSNPSKLAHEIKYYSNEVVTDFTDAAEEFICLPTSKKKLQESEEDILKGLDPKGKIEDVVVEEVTDGNKVIIHTVCFEPTVNDEPSKFPLVLIHGYAGGLACFHKNFSSLCKKRKVYAIDLPGFALSSRVEFPDPPTDCKDRMVDLIEKWREAMNLEQFIILGHSFGGYISASYTLKYKERVRHLILADSWGVLGRKDDKRKLNPLQKLVVVLELNPHEFIRKSMAVGHYLHEKFMPKKIRSAYGEKLVPYFYHANAQPKATGEKAFANISDEYLWPHNPLKECLANLDHVVPITFLYGKESKFKNSGGKDVQRMRKNIFLPAALNAGHHIQAEDHEGFNKKVNEFCDMVDGGTDREPETVQSTV